MEDGETQAPALGRRRFLRLIAAWAAATATVGVAAAPATEASGRRARLPSAGQDGSNWDRRGTLPSPAYRAVVSYQAQQAHLYARRCLPGDTTPLYLEQAAQSGGRSYASVWAFSQATAATLDLLGLPAGYGDYRSEVRDRFDAGLPHYWDGTSYLPCAGPAHAVSGIWYDDNAWLGLDLVRRHRLTGEGAALARARQVFDFITTGWHADKAGHAPGGVYWVRGNPNRHRNTCSNGPSAELGLRLHQLTGESAYLRWAEKMYGWVNDTLRAPDGLYWDHIDEDGSIDRTLWSYNQGTMIGAGALLYRITGDGAYLAQARASAGAALAYYAEAGLSRQPPSFNAIFFRNLLHLAALDGTHLAETRRLMQGYADDAWLTSRSAEGLFPFPAARPVAKLLHQAGMVQVFACLAWDADRYDLLV